MRHNASAGAERDAGVLPLRWCIRHGVPILRSATPTVDRVSPFRRPMPVPPAPEADQAPLPHAREVTTPAVPPTDPPPTVDTRALDRSFVHGIAWTGAAKWISQLVAWCGTI